MDGELRQKRLQPVQNVRERVNRFEGIVVLGAMGGKLAFGQHEVGARGETEIGTAIADQHQHTLRLRRPAFADAAYALAFGRGCWEIPLSSGRRRSA